MGPPMGHRSWDLVTLGEGQARSHPQSPRVSGPAVSRDGPRRSQVTICGSPERSLFMGGASHPSAAQ